MNGIGERAGNAALEEVVMALTVRADRLPYRTAIEAKQIYASSQLVTRLTGQSVQANKAVVGRNAFAHEAGIHQDGVLKDRRTYEIMRAADVGAPPPLLVLGKHSGRHAIARRCAELGVPLHGEQLTEVYRALMAIADERKMITDNDVRTVRAARVAQVAGNRPARCRPRRPWSCTRLGTDMGSDPTSLRLGV